jgi:hypothetical protein
MAGLPDHRHTMRRDDLSASRTCSCSGPLRRSATFARVARPITIRFSFFVFRSSFFASTVTVRLTTFAKAPAVKKPDTTFCLAM